MAYSTMENKIRTDKPPVPWEISAKSIGQRIKEFRKRRHETIRDLAKALRTSSSYLSELESGRADNPGANLIVRLATHFGCSTDYLLGAPLASRHADDIAEQLRHVIEQLEGRI